jgi:hypothetical protein
MTRKDYILIARALNYSYRTAGMSTPAIDAIDFAAASIANELGRENPRFNQNHFLAVVRGEKALESRPPR